jgi:hypothetical protein
MKHPSPPRCRVCRRAIPWGGRGRRPRYCSPGHRQVAYVERLRQRAHGRALVVQPDAAALRFVLDVGMALGRLEAEFRPFEGEPAALGGERPEHLAAIIQAYRDACSAGDVGRAFAPITARLLQLVGLEAPPTRRRETAAERRRRTALERQIEDIFRQVDEMGPDEHPGTDESSR